MDMDRLCINTIRTLSIDMVQKANSGHPGMPLGAAPMAYVLWTRFLKFNPGNPGWMDRDRFVLSAGHGSALLYCLLHLTGYGLPMSEIKRFRQWGSMTPGHPEYGCAPGVECTTGPLGQGFSVAVGMAMAEKFLAANFNRPGDEIVGHHTYAICSDGDLMEGIASEAASLAGHFKLGKIIFLYDDNHISLSGSTELTFTEDVPKRFEAYGWHTQYIGDGNDIEAIHKAIQAAKEETVRPSLISVRTHIGFGSPHMQDTFEVHGKPLGEEEVRATKKNLGWPYEEPFYVPPEALQKFREAVDRGASLEAGWNRKVEGYGKKYPDLMNKWKQMMELGLPAGWESRIPSFPPDAKGIKTRVAGGKIMNAIAPDLPFLIGGSGDLNESTHTALEGKGTFEPPEAGNESVQGSAGKWGYDGPNISYGVREHAMGGITSGLALHGGLLPYASTFLIFSDFMRPAIRLACMMGLRLIYVFTHDSIGLGEDGPTHQPVEHIPSLRAMPNMTVIRPCDANETAEAWKAALMHKGGGPVSLLLTRQDVPVLDRSVYAPASGLHKGAYVIAGSPSETPDLILIATGSEVALAIDAYEKISSEGIKVRVVSMPCQEFFDSQPEDYKNSVLPPEVAERIVIEAAAPEGWHKYAPEGVVMGLDHFGASAPGKTLLKKFGFTVEDIMEKASALLGRRAGLFK
ncbi:MAG: transketolase [Nitrospiraceae bacterium]|nr:transketolase [Nitrospiraceae bacterium]